MGINSKKLIAVTILALLLQIALFCGAAYGADMTINVEADKFVDNTGAYPDGYSDAEISNMLAVGHDNEFGDETAVLRFDLSAIIKDVGLAKLKIYILERHADGGDPFITVSGSSSGDTWNENDVTIPAGEPLTTEDISTGDVGTWKEFDVTDFVTDEAAGDNKATFVLTGPSSGVQSDIFTYDRAKAGFGAYLEITYANNAPVLVAIGNKTVNEGSELNFTASASDEDLNTLTYSLVGAPTGATINASTGAFSWIPTEVQGPGTHTFTIKVTDDGTPNLSDSEEITVTVNEVNTAPVLAAIGNKTVDEGSELTFTATASDADLPANTLTYSLVGAPAGASINAATGAFNWIPTEAQGGSSYTFTIKVADGGIPSLTDEEEITVTVAKVNNAPVLAAIGNKSVDEGLELTFAAIGTDADIPVDTLTYSLSAAAPAGTAINSSTGAFSWTPTETQGPGNYPFAVIVTDSGGLTDSENITITVNEVNTAPVLAVIGDKAVDEGSALTFTASASDVDLPANTLTYSLAGTVPTGAGINSSTGAFSWTPTEVQGPGNYIFTVKVTDNGSPNLSDSEEITVTINEVNAAPVLAAIGNKTVDEGSELTFTATASDTDLPANTLTYSLVDEPTGASIDAATGAFNWIPTEAQGGSSYTFTIKVADGGIPSLTDEEEITVTVAKVNNAPVLAAIGNKSVDEGLELTFTAIGTDADIPADTLTYSLSTAAPAGTAINSSTGAFSWTPTETQGPGNYSFTVIVTDSGGLTDSEDITVTVNETNTAPVLTAIGNKTVNEGSALTFTANATDADDPANTLTYSLEGAPAGATINTNTGAFSWTPTEAQGPGNYTFTVKVADNGSPNLFDNEEITVTVNEVNTAPVLAAIGNKTVDEGSELTFTASASDVDLPANTLTYSLVGAPSGASINATTGAFSWTPTEAQGGSSYTFKVKVTDNGTGSLTGEEEITVTVAKVNNAPVLAAIGNQTVDELTVLTFSATGTDTDIPADTLTYSLAGTVPAGASINVNTGVFSWTPTEAQGPGSYTFTVQATDNGSPNLSDEETITVTVNEINTAPVLAAIGNKSVNEGSELTFTVSASDADLPANTLTYSLEGAPAGATINTNTGAFSWIPTEAQGPGNYTFTVKVTDNGSPNLSASEEITVTVNEVNIAPVLAAIGNKTVDEGSELTFTVSASDADLPTNTLTYSLEGTVPDGAAIDPATGAFSWTPTEAQGGSSYTFMVKVTDNGAGSLTDEEEITVTVNEVNIAPILTSIGDQTVDEGSELTFKAIASDTDLPANTLTYSLMGDVPAGAIINSATGDFSWTPAENQGPGSYIFSVKVTDNGAGSLTDEEEITVTVNEVNIAPILTSIGDQTVDEGNELTFTASASDTDLPANTLTYSLMGNVPAGASIDPDTGVFNWTPTEDHGPGDYTFTVKVTDNGAGNLTDSEEITVTVNEVNTAPVLAAIGNQTVNELNPLTFTASASDIDLPVNILTYSLVGAPAGANIDPATGAFRWTPTEDQGGSSYTFKVKVADGGIPSLTDEEEITVDVNEVNIAPTLDPLVNLSLAYGAGAQTVNLTGISAGGSETQAIDVTASSSDTTLIPAITVNYTSPETTGTLTFTPQGSGTATVTVTVTDNGGTANGGADTTTRTFTVTVASPNNSSHGGTNQTNSNLSTVNTIISSAVDTSDDKTLNNNLAQQGNAVFNLSGDGDAKAIFSSEVVNALGQAQMPLTIENQGIKVEFPPAALEVQELQEVPKDAQKVVEIKVREVTLQEKEDILAAAHPQESSGLFEIGGKMIELTAQVVTTALTGTVAANKVEGFPEPVAVTIDLSNWGQLSPEQIAGLTGVRFEKDSAGNIVTVKLGGSYDPATMRFTFYTDSFSYYSVLRAESLVQIHLTVDAASATINGVGKTLDVAPTIIDSRTMVPVRFVSEALGADVEWRESTRTVEIKLDGQELSLVIGQTYPGLDVPVQIVNGRTMVPLRYVSESLGAYVKWFPSERKVEIIR